MIKLFLYLLVGTFLLAPAVAKPVIKPVFAASMLADTTVPATTTLRLILDSLRNQPTLKGVKIKLQDINFETNSFVLTASSAAYLDTIAGVLNKIPAVMLEIGGHTDNVGPPQRNLTLSQNRAQAVRNRLVGAGMVTAKRVTFRGYGEGHPVAPNTTDAGRTLNRRVEMQFVGLDNGQITKIYLRDGQIIPAALVYLNEQTQSVLYKIDENTPLLELPCDKVLKLIYADNRVKLLDCPPPPKESTPPVSAAPAAQIRQKRVSPLYLVIQAGAGYMLGENPAWTSKTIGYAHVLGFGGNLLAGYRLSNRISVGLQTGYWRWSTLVEYKTSSDGPVIRRYNSDATQIPLSVTIPVYITKAVYLMPEGGINLLTINAGFDDVRERFTGLQTSLGGTLGYTTDHKKRVWFDAGLFYRVHQKATWDKQYGVPAMNYAGLKLGLGFSL
ncbi:OmpA family protein [Fibrella forsythiae]|uniref:OmpA family protein n=1 Tax=Fibrella forsythiae TaxID=2817061 RepID=A0ABS3JI04_9BACT|nr:OmpA family protein [Fibrella forsythiae]MBO0949628.1 OmpA family protein [Fibrella forsythiae]